MIPTRKGSFHLYRFAGIDLYLHWLWFVVCAFEIEVVRTAADHRQSARGSFPRQCLECPDREETVPGTNARNCLIRSTQPNSVPSEKHSLHQIDEGRPIDQETIEASKSVPQ